MSEALSPSRGLLILGLCRIANICFMFAVCLRSPVLTMLCICQLAILRQKNDTFLKRVCLIVPKCHDLRLTVQNEVRKNSRIIRSLKTCLHRRRSSMGAGSCPPGELIRHRNHFPAASLPVRSYTSTSHWLSSVGPQLYF